MSVYSRYTREDDLCQTNGYFSLNLRRRSVDAIDGLLRLTAASTLGWVGCGDGREVLSIAKRHPETQITAFEINKDALGIALRVASLENVKNVEFRNEDFLTCNGTFSHIYSTALAGPPLYAALFSKCSMRICVFREMWGDEVPGMEHAVVFLAGSGERRQLWCANINGSALVS